MSTSSPTRKAKNLVLRTLRDAGELAGVQIVPKNFYSPIPEIKSLPQDLWDRRSELAGIDFDLDTQLAWIEQKIGPAMKEFSPATEQTANPHEYTLANDSYGRVGADILYGIVRGLKPRRILELGSGQSTLIMAEAVLANAEEEVSTELRTFDPFPSIAGSDNPGIASLRHIAAQDVPSQEFAALKKGDILFIDTTHTVKLGSDVNHLLLDVLPNLKPGVIVHIHDIFLPYEYPREFADRAIYWNEQYLLQAFLIGNPNVEILCATYALCRDRSQAISKLAPTWIPGASASAFWFRISE
jgi:hypothetical protein